MKKFTAILLILLSMTTPVWANEILVNYEGSPFLLMRRLFWKMI